MEYGIPYEVVADILLYISPDRLNMVARWSNMGRWVVNSMDRARYIDMWLHYIPSNNNTYCYPYWMNVSIDRMEYEIRNYWYFILSFSNETYPKLLEVIKQMRDRRLCITIANTSISRVNMLWGVYSLDLSSCRNIRDVGALGGVNRLGLGGCSGITDVSALGNVKNLNLSLTMIKDVSMLGSVETLGLYYAMWVGDVCALGNVKKLCIDGCKKIWDSTDALNGRREFKTYLYYSKVDYDIVDYTIEEE